ncbi:hypothetical protein EZV62_011074 [Acer yangbiense]|uniref:SWIM-type domain-containing protein n=1 Tax=Acer yangbiense TaxID=1000413 RepID=A0A5C7I4B4_9ROSI|nr:hypothetical protein EZV62_011074 [Acer yangbiense]
MDMKVVDTKDLEDMKVVEAKDLEDSFFVVEVLNEEEVGNMSNGEEKVKLEVGCTPKSIITDQDKAMKNAIEVGEDNHRFVAFIVHLNEVNCEVNCNCRLFESKGILCRHAIAVLIRHGIFCIPDKYILRRWRKDVKRCHTKVKISYDNWDVKPEGQRFDRMCNSFYEVADLATNNEETFCMVMEAKDRLKAKLTLDGSGGGSSQCCAILIEDAIGNEELNNTSNEKSNILTPRVVRSKGRPPYKRKQSKICGQEYREHDSMFIFENHLKDHQSILLRDTHNVTTISENAYLGVQAIDENASIEKEKGFVQDNQYLRLQEDELEG